MSALMGSSMSKILVVTNNLNVDNELKEKCRANPDKKEMDKKTLLIRKYMDKNIRNSMQI